MAKRVALQEQEDDATDAARWRALLRSGCIRVIAERGLERGEGPMRLTLELQSEWVDGKNDRPMFGATNTHFGAPRLIRYADLMRSKKL